MTVSGGGAVSRELVRALVAALEQALSPSASASAIRSAIDTVQVLGLASLERLLEALGTARDGRPWTGEKLEAIERLRALAAECGAVASLDPLRLAGTELDSWAHRVGGGVDSGRPSAPPPPVVTTLGLAEVLEDVTLGDKASSERAQRMRVAAPVAAALRAALDWLAEEGRPRPLRIGREESVVELLVPGVNGAGLRPAEKVLSAVGGVLLPASALGVAPAPPGAWVIRAPAHSGRRSHLMIVQGDLALALPWHAVLRLYMVPAIELESGLGGLGSPVLEPLRPVVRGRGEHPVVLIGHGMKRAYLIADRLVWRLEGEPCEPAEAPPLPSLTRAVKTDENEIYWVVDPAVALAGVSPLEIPQSPPATASPPVPVLESNEVEPIDEVPAPDALEVERGESPAPAVARIEPDHDPAASPARETAPAPDPVERTSAESRVPAPLRALVAEDSIAARLFLTRLLEREGFTVRAVTTSTELFDELVDPSWTLVCVDIELPDGPERMLEGVITTVATSGSPPVIGLIRDDADLAVAREAGVARTLRKPFDPAALKDLLRALGLAGAP